MERLPQFPALATKLLRVLSHDDADVKEIVNLIRSDTALSSELLRIVNSPMYGFSGRVGSIQIAVSLLGFTTIKSFALTVSMRAMFQGALRLDLLRKIWRHSLACALLCEDLSIACSPVRRADDRAYTCGLLHDVGRLALFVEHPNEYGSLLTGSEHTGILEIERQVFGVDHCELGALLAGHWGLPEEIRLVTSLHHQPVSKSGFELIDLVRVAVLLAEELGFEAVPPSHALTPGEILSMLPPSAQYRIDADPEMIRARVQTRLDALD
jgi:HD-like signal output (HDOD) protein